jgi:hypothetical protein
VVLHELIHANGSQYLAANQAQGQDASCLLLIQAAQWKIDYPAALVTFGVGSFEPHSETVKRKDLIVFPFDSRAVLSATLIGMKTI